jgi:hypothetical protein
MHKNENLRFLIASLVERSYDIESNLPQIEVNRLHAALDELRQLETQLQRITLPHIKPEDLACKTEAKQDDFDHADAQSVRIALEFVDDLIANPATEGAIEMVLIHLERALGKPEPEGAEHIIPDGWHAALHDMPDATSYWVDPKTGSVVCGVNAEYVRGVEISELPDNPVVIVKPDRVKKPELELVDEMAGLVDKHGLPAVAESLAQTIDDINDDMLTVFESPEFTKYCGEICGHLRNFVAACVNTKDGDPRFTEEAWKREVADNGTTMGYHDWVIHRTKCYRDTSE